jgi:hypothetical protein
MTVPRSPNTSIWPAFTAATVSMGVLEGCGLEMTQRCARSWSRHSSSWRATSAIAWRRWKRLTTRELRVHRPTVRPEYREGPAGRCDSHRSPLQRSGCQSSKLASSEAPRADAARAAWIPGDPGLAAHPIATAPFQSLSDRRSRMARRSRARAALQPSKRSRSIHPSA